MQGKQSGQQELFSTINLEIFILIDHFLRKVDKLLAPDLFNEIRIRMRLTKYERDR